MMNLFQQRVQVDVPVSGMIQITGGSIEEMAQGSFSDKDLQLCARGLRSS